MKLLIILMLLSASVFGDNLPDGELCKRTYDCASKDCIKNDIGEWRCGVYKPVSAGIKNGRKCERPEDSFNCESGWCKEDDKKRGKFTCHKKLKDGAHCLGPGECESNKCADPNGIDHQAWSGEFNSRKVCGALGALSHACKENFECKSNYCTTASFDDNKTCHKKPEEVLRQENLQEYYNQLSKRQNEVNH